MRQNTEIGICSWFGFKYSYEERIKFIKDAGFQSVMIWWGEEHRETNASKEMEPEIARKYGLNVENAHFPFNIINSLWEDSSEGDNLLNKYLLSIDDCKKHEIPTAVMHVTSGDNPPPFNQLGLDRFKRLVERAEKNNINIALENVHTLEHLDNLFDSIESDKLKFCYDSGHENCFTPGKDCLAKYGSKLAALHLHDNDGIRDQHMLPFNASVNWERIMKKLKEINYKGTLSLEVDAQYSNVINDYTAEKFLMEARERACRLLKI